MLSARAEEMSLSFGGFNFCQLHIVLDVGVL